MSFCFVFFPSELVGGGKVSDLFLNYLSCMKDLSDCFSELLSPVPFSGHVCCSQCCTAAASPGVVNSEKKLFNASVCQCDPDLLHVLVPSCLLTPINLTLPTWIPVTDKAGLG